MNIKPIRNDDDLRAAFARLETVFQAAEGSPEADEMEVLVALIESQLADYLIDHPEDQQLIRDNVRMLYPEPTVWTSHPVIARTENGEKLMQALLDPELQQLGWEIIGFRPALPGVDIDVAKSGVPGILPQIDSTIDSPGDAVMAQVKEATTNDPGSGAPRRACTETTPDASPAA